MFIFQGITKSFSIAYHHVDVRQKTMRISESAVSWIHRRSPNVHEITVYMVEPDGKGQDYVLRKMMTTDHKGTTGLKKNPPKLERRDNLFRYANNNSVLSNVLLTNILLITLLLGNYGCLMVLFTR